MRSVILKLNVNGLIVSVCGKLFLNGSGSGNSMMLNYWRGENRSRLIVIRFGMISVRLFGKYIYIIGIMVFGLENVIWIRWMRR